MSSSFFQYAPFGPDTSLAFLTTAFAPVQDVEDAAISRAGSDDAESLDTMSETGGSPVSSLTGGSFWPPPVRVGFGGFGGLRTHSGLSSFRRRSSAAGGQGAPQTLRVHIILTTPVGHDCLLMLSIHGYVFDVCHPEHCQHPDSRSVMHLGRSRGRSDLASAHQP